MRSAEQGAVATASTDAAFASLERRLVSLRSEIDAILAELTSQKATAAIPQEAPQLDVEPEASTAEATDAEAAPDEMPPADIGPEVAGQFPTLALACDTIEPIATGEATEAEASRELEADGASLPIASAADVQQ